MARKPGKGFSGPFFDDPFFDDPYSSSKNDFSTKSYTPTTRCYHDHPPYEIAPGLVIYGGSCISPVVKDADVYGGFDLGMTKQGPQYPWSPKQEGPVEFLFRIQDMQAPTNPAEFKKMIDWLTLQLQTGKKVHLGCIGGHGRTGLVLAALRKHLTDDKDAITHVRENYCKKAVESSSQVKFLHEHWGVKAVAGAKSYSAASKGSLAKIPKSSSRAPQSTGLPQLGLVSDKTQKLKGGAHFTELTAGLGFDLSKKQKYHVDEPPVKKRESTGAPLRKHSSIWG